MTGALVAGLLAGYGVAVPVGAVAVLVVGLTARTSLRVGAAAALGVATADGVYAPAAVAGAFAASASWQLVLAGGGALVGRVLTGRRGRLVTALASGVLIAGIAVFIVWS